EVGQRVRPESGEPEQLGNREEASGPLLPGNERGQEAAEVVQATADGVAQASHKARQSVQGNLLTSERNALWGRLKQTVGRLRERNDYPDSVATLSRLMQEYGKAYVGVARTAGNLPLEAVVNPDLHQAVQHFWGLVRTVGGPPEWDPLHESVHAVTQQG